MKLHPWVIVIRHLAAVSACFAFALTGCASGSQGGLDDGGRQDRLTDKSAEDFVQSLIEQSSDLDPNSFCAAYAANLTMCEGSLRKYGSQPEIVTAWSDVVLAVEPSHSGSMIVTLQREDGAASAIEVLLDEGEIRAVDPVFWVERTIVG